MSGGHLHAVVEAIATAGSQQLARRVIEGAAVPFDLVEGASSGGAPLFSYQPRTREFVDDHVDVLRQLPAWPSAVNVLAGFDGLGDYLLSHGERHVPIDARERADLVLRVLLASMHAETGDFLHTPGRTAAATAQLARCVLGGREEATIVVPLLGVRLGCERLDLEHGLALVRDDAIPGLPRDARSPLPGRPGTLAVVDVLSDQGAAAGMAVARPRLRTLLTALRLYDAPAPALAPVAWCRVRDGWASHPFIGACSRANGTLELHAAHADALRGFCDHITRAARLSGAAGWALRRFELACERADHGESLTDALLGLRALLEADQPGSGMLAERLAVLCARPDSSATLRDRTQLAEAIERALMHGEAVAAPDVRELATELRGHLRALLRDIACGHLPADLAPVADRHRAGVPLPPPVAAPVVTRAPEPEREPQDAEVPAVNVTPAAAVPATVDAPPADHTQPPVDAAQPADAPASTFDELTQELFALDAFDMDEIVDVLDTRIDIDDAPLPDSDAGADAQPHPAVTPPPAVLGPAEPAPGQIAAARLPSTHHDVAPDAGEPFEERFVRTFTEGADAPQGAQPRATFGARALVGAVLRRGER